ncbi:unnamed protein product [Closterium sp. NIES-53]
MARLLTALALLLAFTVTLESFAYTDAARSVRLPGNGASGAVDTAGGVITAKSAPSFAEPSAGDEQGRRELQTTQSDCADAITRNCDEFINGATDPPADNKKEQRLANTRRVRGQDWECVILVAGGKRKSLLLAAVDVTSLAIMWACTGCG